MNTVEQVLGSYGQFAYNPDKKKSSIERGDDFEKLLENQDSQPAPPVKDTESHTIDEVSTAAPANAGAVLYLYNYFGETTVMELQNGINVNKLV